MAFLYQIIKSLVFALDTSACRLLLVFESINIYMSCLYRCLSKEKKVISTTYALAQKV